MSKKIMGVTVGTPLSPDKIKEKLNPGLTEAVNTALQQAKESGEFDGKDGETPEVEISDTYSMDSTNPGVRRHGVTISGPKIVDENGYFTLNSGTVWDGKDGKDGADGKPGQDYVLTDTDKEEIAEMAAVLVDVPSDEHINSLINTALGVIENGTY